MTGLSTSQLLAVIECLSDRDKQLMLMVERFRLVSGSQARRLLWAESGELATEARLARRGLSRLEALGLLDRLERRIGGVRAGSAGSVFTLSAAGQRAARYLAGAGLTKGRTPHEPGSQYLRHTLAVTEIYVLLREAERAGRLDLLAFDPEPTCWRSYIGRGGARLTLKPDAFVKLGVGAYEDSYFMEIDCGSAGRGTLDRKARDYLAYYRTGAETADGGVFPRVLWVTTTAKRRTLIVDVLGRLPAEAWRLFAVTTTDAALDLVTGDIEAAAARPKIGGGS